MECYKIKNKDGKFATGGYGTSFTKNGKTWNTKSALSNHITQIAKATDYLECNLVIMDETGYREEPIYPMVLTLYTNYCKNKYFVMVTKIALVFRQLKM